MFLLNLSSSKIHITKHLFKNLNGITSTNGLLKFAPRINEYTTKSVPDDNASKICIIGSGPAAMYTAQYVLKSLPNAKKSIDIYERLPVPFGLVRYGVSFRGLLH